MKSSGLLKWLMIPVALLVLWVMIRVFSGGDGGAATGDRSPRLTPEEMRALGIEGDSPHDTVATLIGQVKQLRTELPVGLGLRDEDMLAAERDTLQWVEPSDAPSAEGRQAGTATGFPNRFGPAQQPLQTEGADASSPASFSTVAAATPIYTLPANATLMGSISMTALIGRVPIDGTVNDTYPFKVLTLVPTT